MSRKFFHTCVLLLLTGMFFRAATQQCTGGRSEKSILGWMLQRHVYKNMSADLPHTCVLSCRKDDRCQSFNWVISLSTCEFSNRTKEARPEDFIPNPDRFYFKRDKNRVPLGSIPELPAETCKEIKASKGGQAVSKKYWFSSIQPGVPVLAYCDMKTEDVDECTAFPAVCDDNANCTNTRGSYRCTCKSGFSGDGKTCKDVDECTASPSVCDVNANCNNTRGSYNCTCKPGFFGDGKTCADGLAVSVIIGKNKTYLANLTNWLSPVVQSVNSVWKRCWRASVDGWNAKQFHAKCDGKGPTVTIIRVGRKYIFGGYTSLSWGSSSGQYQYDSKAFLFSLVNKPGWAPVKLPQTGQHNSYRNSIYSDSSYGPTFGGGHDIHIYNQASSNRYSYTDLGHTYSPPSGHSYQSTFARTFLAGGSNYYFTPDEVETFYETT